MRPTNPLSPSRLPGDRLMMQSRTPTPDILPIQARKLWTTHTSSSSTQAFSPRIVGNGTRGQRTTRRSHISGCFSRPHTGSGASRFETRPVPPTAPHTTPLYTRTTGTSNKRRWTLLRTWRQPRQSIAPPSHSSRPRSRSSQQSL